MKNMDADTKKYLDKLFRLRHEIETAMMTDNELASSSPIEGRLYPLFEAVEKCIGDIYQDENEN